MTRDTDVEEGDVFTHSRTFTNDDVREFAELSEDEGYHHLVADEDGTVVVHGLLTATLPTKLGGELDYLARSMEFEFPRPVYTGEEVTCELSIENVDETQTRYVVEGSFVCTNEDGDVVLEGTSDGVIFK